VFLLSPRRFGKSSLVGLALLKLKKRHIRTVSITVSGDFASEFITSTLKWSKYWENDRVHARRPFVAVPQSSKIDALLQKYLPELFAEIQLAPGRW
jgi:hypothetical protein